MIRQRIEEAVESLRYGRNHREAWAQRDRNVARSLKLETAGFVRRHLFWRVPRYKTLEEFVYVSTAGDQFVVPKGFVFDGASIPPILWTFLHPMGRYRNAALVHDYLYSTGRVEKYRADDIFLEMMAKLKVPLHRRRLMYRAVQLFGRGGYQRP